MTASIIFDYAVLNGLLLPLNEANISIFNQAIFSSFGVYETVKIDRGRPFYLQDHLRRLLASARLIDLDIAVSVQTLTDWFQMLVQLDPAATWSLKIIALGTTEPADKPVIAMQPTALPSYPPELYQHGASATLYPGQRVLPACKSLNTLVNYLARHKARQAGALEGLLYHNNQLTEGARSNLFAVRQGQIFTPPATEVLSGITRDIILQVMQNSRTPVIEAPVPADVSIYEEFFISSTSMHVMPITKIDGQAIGSGQVGPITKTVMARFNAHYREYMATTSAGRLS